MLLERSTTLDSIETAYDWWEEVKIETLIGIWKKLVLVFMNDREIPDWVEELIADVIEILKNRSGVCRFD